MAYNYFDRNELRNRLAAVKKGDDFPLLLDMYPNRLILPDGKSTLSDERLSYLHLMGSSLQAIQNTVPQDQLRAGELMHVAGEQEGREVNFE